MDLLKEVRFFWRSWWDNHDDSSDMGTLSMVPVTGETAEQWWERHIRAGRGEEAQRLLEEGFKRYLPNLPQTTVLPIHPEVPPTGDLYRSRYINRVAYGIPPFDRLSEQVKREIEFEMDMPLAEQAYLTDDGIPVSAPHGQARWWMLSETDIRRVLSNPLAEEMVLSDARKNGALLACGDNVERGFVDVLSQRGYAFRIDDPQPFEELLQDIKASSFLE